MTYTFYVTILSLHAVRSAQAKTFSDLCSQPMSTPVFNAWLLMGERLVQHIHATVLNQLPPSGHPHSRSDHGPECAAGALIKLPGRGR